VQDVIYEIPLTRIGGTETVLGEYRGQVLLIVNVASRCGYTPQYDGLEKLFERYHEQGLQVLGFPANDFLEQEPGSDEDIRQFCTDRFGVRFPMFSKITVTGPGKHPLYRHLVEASPETTGRTEMEQSLRGYGITPTEPPEVVWNFEKFLVGRDGNVLARFSPKTTPEDPALIAAIESEL